MDNKIKAALIAALIVISFAGALSVTAKAHNSVTKIILAGMR